jgi:hypothetical protein
MPAGGAGQKSFPAALAEARELAEVVCVDSPEYALASSSFGAGDFRMAGQRTIIQLGCKHPPEWARECQTGPLFTKESAPNKAREAPAVAVRLLDQFLSPEWSTCRIDWQLLNIQRRCVTWRNLLFGLLD